MMWLLWALKAMACAQNGQVMQASPYRTAPSYLLLNMRTLTPDFIHSLKSIH